MTEKTVQFVLENDVPLMGRKGGGRSGTSKYPFASMEPGQSFLVGEEVKAGTIRSAIGAFMKTHKEEGYKFAVRQTEDGLRVWRVE